jgi:hypothetical protein
MNNDLTLFTLIRMLEGYAYTDLFLKILSTKLYNNQELSCNTDLLFLPRFLSFYISK